MASDNDFSAIVQLMDTKKLYEEQEEKWRIRLSDKDEEIAKLEHQLNDKDRTVEGRSQTIAEMEEELARLKTENDRIQKEGAQKDRAAERAHQGTEPARHGDRGRLRQGRPAGVFQEVSSRRGPKAPLRAALPPGLAQEFPLHPQGEELRAPPRQHRRRQGPDHCPCHIRGHVSPLHRAARDPVLVQLVSRAPHGHQPRHRQDPQQRKDRPSGPGNRRKEQKRLDAVQPEVNELVEVRDARHEGDAGRARPGGQRQKKNAPGGGPDPGSPEA